jgi:YVTN family beta-propeller protein
MTMLRTLIWLTLFSVAASGQESAAASAQGSAAASAQEVAVIVHKWDNSVGFYDSNSGEQLAKVDVGVKPHEMALSADRRLAYITNYGVNSYTEQEEGGNSISILDLVRREKVGEIELGKFHRPHGIELGRSGRLYVTCDFPPSLLVIDPARRAVLREYAVGQNLPHMLMITRDEKKAYTSNSGSGTVTAIDLGAGKVIRHIDIGGVPMGMAMSKDERILYAANRTGNRVAVIDLRRYEVSGWIEIQGQPVRAGLTPDGRNLIVTLIESGEVAVIDASSRLVRRRIRTGANSEGIGIDPSGRFGYVSAQGENKVVKFSLKDLRPLLEIKTAARPDPIAIIKIQPPTKR